MMPPPKRCRVQKKQNGQWVDTPEIHQGRKEAAIWATEKKLGDAGVDWQIVEIP